LRHRATHESGKASAVSRVRVMSESTLPGFLGEFSLMFLGKLVGDQGIDHRFTSVASWLQQGRPFH
jgi:fructose-1-phosphate kinase PfkB-like protein